MCRGGTVIGHIFRINKSASVRAWGARASHVPASRPVQAARAAWYGVRKWYTGWQNDAPPRGLPPAVVRVTTRCPWTRRRPVEVAGHVFSLSCTSMCRRVPHLCWLCTSIPILLISFLVLISVIEVLILFDWVLRFQLIECQSFTSVLRLSISGLTVYNSINSVQKFWFLHFCPLISI